MKWEAKYGDEKYETLVNVGKNKKEKKKKPKHLRNK